MDKIDFNDLVGEQRPTKYSYEIKELVESGYAHRYSIDFENPDFQTARKHLEKNNKKYKIVTPPNRTRMRDIWIKN